MSFTCPDVNCTRSFQTFNGVYTHARVQNHVIHACAACKRLFSNDYALVQHMNSTIHSDDLSSEEYYSDYSDEEDEPKRTYDCPFCNRIFVSPSAVAQHVESGYHGVTRHQVTEAVHALEIAPEISVQKRITGPTDQRHLKHVITYGATEMSFNGRSYECYLCHRTFQYLDALNRHLNSPAHDADEFKCPGCKKKFKVISALIQHIESGACGVAKFKTVSDHFNSLTATFSKLLTL